MRERVSALLSLPGGAVASPAAIEAALQRAASSARAELLAAGDAGTGAASPAAIFCIVQPASLSGCLVLAGVGGAAAEGQCARVSEGGGGLGSSTAKADEAQSLLDWARRALARRFPPSAQPMAAVVFPPAVWSLAGGFLNVQFKVVRSAVTAAVEAALART